MKFSSYPYFTGALMIHLGWDVWTLCDEFEACRFMRVSGFGFGGLDVALLFSVSTGTGAAPSLLSEKKLLS